MDVTKRLVLITGGALGLGKEMGRNLLSQGHRVIVLDKKKSDAMPDDYRNMISDFHRVDVADFEKVNVVLDKVLNKYGCVDVLINNAALRLFKPFFEFKRFEIERYLDVNFGTPMMLVSKVYSYMKEKGYGRIINISSFSAFSGYSRGSLYCSTKCALKVFSESVGKELDSAENVTMNVICPDSFSTAEGQPTGGYEYIVGRVNRTVDKILTSKCNGQVFVIAERGNIVINCLRELKNDISWLIGG